MGVKDSTTKHKYSSGQSPIPVVTMQRVTNLSVPLFQRCGTGTLTWFGRLEGEVGRNRKRYDDS